MFWEFERWELTEVDACDALPIDFVVDLVVMWAVLIVAGDVMSEWTSQWSSKKMLTAHSRCSAIRHASRPEHGAVPEARMLDSITFSSSLVVGEHSSIHRLVYDNSTYFMCLLVVQSLLIVHNFRCFVKGNFAFAGTVLVA